MRGLSPIVLLCLLSLPSCSSKDRSKDIDIADSSITMTETANSQIEMPNQNVLASKTINEQQKVVVPEFYILKREREDYNDYTPRTRFHIKTPKLYTESELEIIADSLLNKERAENGISEIWVNYYLPKKKLQHSNSYGLSIRLKTERSSTIFQREEKKRGYNPPRARDLSNENLRTKQLWGAFDQGQIAGYEAGYKDGKKRRRAYYSFDSYYPTSDEWIEQSYKQGYEVGYLDGFDDAGGTR